MSTHRNHFFFNSLPDFEKEAEEAKRIAKMPKAPSFSLDDMEAARKASHEDGRLLGLEQATNSIEQQTEILIQSLTDRIHDLKQAEIKRHQKAVAQSIEIAQKALEKLLPAMMAQEQETFIKLALTDFFKDHIAKSNLTLIVHPDMQESMEKYAPLLHADLKLATSGDLTPAQARLEWQDGVFEFKPDVMIESILGMFKQYNDTPVETLDDSVKNPHTITKDDNEMDSDHE